jgi:glutamine synthetase
MHLNKSLPAILQLLTEKNATKVKLAITDIDGILRGKIISFEKFKSVAASGFGFCDVVFGWDAADMAYDNSSFTGWHSGYPDAKAAIDPQTFREIPWENNMPFFLADFRNSKGDALSVCPRSLLKNIRQQAVDAGFNCSFSQEFEWFNFMGNTAELYASKFSTLQPITNGMFGYSVLRAAQNSAYFNQLFDGMHQFGVPVEGLHTETGPGVYEAAILYADILEAADRAVLFKAGTKEIAHQHGFIASFMAKPNEQLPGCSGHVHQSLWSADGKKNLFFDGAKTNNISALMENYIAGQLHCLPFILPMFAPTVNSYKRLVEGAWAPTTITWAIDNRTTALRALPGSASSTRLETRVVGSDSNPYLAMAACLAAGLYGIAQKMPLKIPATSGSGYQNKTNGVLPASLWEATQAMKSSAVARTLFGDEFTDHFTSSREWEWRQFSKKVTDWELQRYLEII